MSLSSTSGNVQTVQIDGNLTMAGSIGASIQNMTVGGKFTNLAAGIFGIGQAFGGSQRGILTVGGDWENDGTFSVINSFSSSIQGGLVTVGGNALNAGTLSVQGSSFGKSGEFDVTGNFVNTNKDTGGVGSIENVGGYMTNSGAVNLNNNSTLTVSGTYTQTAGSTHIGTGGTITAGEFFLHGGTMGGGGTYKGTVDVTGGTFAPGDPTTTFVTGDYIQSGGALLLVVTSPAAYDQLNVSGNMNITGGTLQVSFASGFTPFAGEIFNFFAVGGAFHGDWSALSFPSTPGGWVLREVPGANGVIAVEVFAPEPGTWLLGAAGVLAMIARRRRRAAGPRSNFPTASES